MGHGPLDDAGRHAPLSVGAGIAAGRDIILGRGGRSLAAAAAPPVSPPSAAPRRSPRARSLGGARDGGVLRRHVTWSRHVLRGHVPQSRRVSRCPVGWRAAPCGPDPDARATDRTRDPGAASRYASLRRLEGRRVARISLFAAQDIHCVGRCKQERTASEIMPRAVCKS